MRRARRSTCHKMGRAVSFRSPVVVTRKRAKKLGHGVRPLKFHIVRTILFILAAVAMALIARHEMHAVWGKELGVTLVVMNGLEMVCEVFCDRLFPIDL